MVYPGTIVPDVVIVQLCRQTNLTQSYNRNPPRLSIRTPSHTMSIHFRLTRPGMQFYILYIRV